MNKEENRAQHGGGQPPPCPRRHRFLPLQKLGDELGEQPHSTDAYEGEEGLAVARDEKTFKVTLRLPKKGKAEESLGNRAEAENKTSDGGEE